MIVAALAIATIALFALPLILIVKRNSETEITDAPEAEADRREFRKTLGGWDK